jgi:hypothetical protein
VFFDQINYYQALFHELGHNAEVRIIPRPMGLATTWAFRPGHKASCREPTEVKGGIAGRRNSGGRRDEQRMAP